ncbi:flagellar hook protein FlgE [Seohaeicola zhoushanensis]|uniref:Flagellar hook protein FlgE n=2 Tax=Seohaeicola zhoushanensis TaxID=1569283 RepID=A0A8J3GUD3_9RHOB|nr:flagellar hook protein FlgE [Seohaeicola zhoushanensis]
MHIYPSAKHKDVYRDTYMSISSAMQTGVAGLLANSSAVSTISTNIANANTDGYRRSFAQMVTTASSTGEGGHAGVRAVSRQNVTVEGSPRLTGVTSDMAISGSGFFVVSRNPNETVAANYAFTRAGSFTPDADGNLRNAAGLYLAGFRYDNNGSLGTVDRSQFSDLQTVNVGDVTIRGEATTSISVQGNLPADYTGPDSTAAIDGQPLVTSQEFYTALGAAQRVEFSWLPSTTPNLWTLTIAAEGVDLGSVDITFADSGPTAGAPLTYSNVTSMAPAPAAFSFDTATGLASLTIDNGTTPQVIELSIGTPGEIDGLSQFSGAGVTVAGDIDGYATGELVRYEIDDKGDLYGIFDNNARHLLYHIPLAEVPNPDGLKLVDGNAYLTTQASGSFNLLGPGTGATGTITTGSLESSNVELAEELTRLIQTQRAYSSNAKIITTVDEMMDETTRLKR